jgi:hypothetical protein
MRIYRVRLRSPDLLPRSGVESRARTPRARRETQATTESSVMGAGVRVPDSDGERTKGSEMEIGHKVIFLL